MSEIRILFTGVGRRIELLQAFKEAALCLDKPLKIYGADMAGTAPALAYCDYVRKVVSMKDSSYIDNLIKICTEDSIDLVIPTIDTDLMVLSENTDKFEAVGTKVMISAPEMIAICRDKNLTSDFFIKCGLNAPKPVNDYRKYDSGYPAFIKPKDGSSSIDAYKVENEEELILYSSQVNDYIVQPYVEGTEYTIDIFCDWMGRPLSIIPRERIQVRAGEVLKTRICLDDKMIEEAKAICKAFKPCGPLTVQLIRDNRDVDWYIEINPRYGGGAPLSMKAGARSAEVVYKLLAGEDVEYETSIEDSAIYSRFDQSVCIEAGDMTIKGVIFDLDDTLYGEKDYVRSGYKAVSDYLGGGYEDELWDYFLDGKPAIDELLIRLNQIDDKDKILDIYRRHKPTLQLYDGVEGMLHMLRSKGIRIGIITDGRPEGQRNKIEALGLADKVDDIIITDELGGAQFRKPCDIAFRIMQTRWRIPAGNIIYVGDNPIKDMQAPKQIGMKSALVCNREGLYSSDAENDSQLLLTRVTDIMDYIK